MAYSLFLIVCKSKLISRWNGTLDPLHWKLQLILYPVIFIFFFYCTGQLCNFLSYLSFQTVLYSFFFFFPTSPPAPPNLCPPLTAPEAQGRDWDKYWCASRSVGCSPEALHPLLAWITLQLIFSSYLTLGVILKHYSMKSLVMSKILASS